MPTAVPSLQWNDYIENVIVNNYVTESSRGRARRAERGVPVTSHARKSHPNLKSSWFSSVMQIINISPVLTVILTRAASSRAQQARSSISSSFLWFHRDHVVQDLAIASSFSLRRAIAVCCGDGGCRCRSLIDPLLFLAARAFILHGRALCILLGTVAAHDFFGQVPGCLAIPVLLVMMLLRRYDADGTLPVWLAVPHECDQPDAAFRLFQARCALSRRRLSSYGPYFWSTCGHRAV